MQHYSNCEVIHCYCRLWGEEDLADVVLATGDHHQITAHKVILRYCAGRFPWLVSIEEKNQILDQIVCSSCSDFFREVLVTHPHQRPLLYLKDVAYRCNPAPLTQGRLLL